MQPPPPPLPLPPGAAPGAAGSPRSPGPPRFGTPTGGPSPRPGLSPPGAPLGPPGGAPPPGGSPPRGPPPPGSPPVPGGPPPPGSPPAGGAPVPPAAASPGGAPPPPGGPPPGDAPPPAGSPPAGGAPPGSPPAGGAPPGSPPAGGAPPGSPPAAGAPPGSPPAGGAPPPPGSPPAGGAPPPPEAPPAGGPPPPPEAPPAGGPPPDAVPPPPPKALPPPPPDAPPPASGGPPPPPRGPPPGVPDLGGPKLMTPFVAAIRPPPPPSGAMMSPGMMAPGMMAPGMMPPGMMAPGMMAPGMMTSGMMPPGMPGTMQPGMMPLGMMPPGMMHPGMMAPQMMAPGMMPPGMVPPGMVPPGMMPQGLTPPAMMPPGEKAKPAVEAKPKDAMILDKLSQIQDFLVKNVSEAAESAKKFRDELTAAAKSAKEELMVAAQPMVTAAKSFETLAAEIRIEPVRDSSKECKTKERLKGASKESLSDSTGSTDSEDRRGTRKRRSLEDLPPRREPRRKRSSDDTPRGSRREPYRSKRSSDDSPRGSRREPPRRSSPRKRDGTGRSLPKGRPVRERINVTSVIEDSYTDQRPDYGFHRDRESDMYYIQEDLQDHEQAQRRRAFEAARNRMAWARQRQQQQFHQQQQYQQQQFHQQQQYQQQQYQQPQQAQQYQPAFQPQYQLQNLRVTSPERCAGPMTGTHVSEGGEPVGVVHRTQRFEYEGPNNTQLYEWKSDGHTEVSAEVGVIAPQQRLPLTSYGTPAPGSAAYAAPAAPWPSQSVPYESPPARPPEESPVISASYMACETPAVRPEEGKRMQLSPTVAVEVARGVEDVKLPTDKKKEVEIKITEQVVISMKDDDQPKVTTTTTRISKEVVKEPSRDQVVDLMKEGIRQSSSTTIHESPQIIEVRSVSKVDVSLCSETTPRVPRLAPDSPYRRRHRRPPLSPALSPAQSPCQPAMSFFGWLKRTCSPDPQLSSSPPCSSSSTSCSSCQRREAADVARIVECHEFITGMPPEPPPPPPTARDPAVEEKMGKLVKLEQLLKNNMSGSPELRRMLREADLYDRSLSEKEAATAAAASAPVAEARDGLRKLMHVETELQQQRAKVHGPLQEPMESKPAVDDSRNKMKSIAEAGLLDKIFVREGAAKDDRKPGVRDFAIGVCGGSREALLDRLLALDALRKPEKKPSMRDFAVEVRPGEGTVEVSVRDDPEEQSEEEGQLHEEPRAKQPASNAARGQRSAAPKASKRRETSKHDVASKGRDAPKRADDANRARESPKPTRTARSAYTSRAAKNPKQSADHSESSEAEEPHKELGELFLIESRKSKHGGLQILLSTNKKEIARRTAGSSDEEDGPETRERNSRDQRSSEESSSETPDTSPDRSPERSLDRPPDRLPPRSPERSPGKSPSRCPARVVAKFTEKVPATRPTKPVRRPPSSPPSRASSEAPSRASSRVFVGLSSKIAGKASGRTAGRASAVRGSPERNSGGKGPGSKAATSATKDARTTPSPARKPKPSRILMKHHVISSESVSSSSSTAQFYYSHAASPTPAPETDSELSESATKQASSANTDDFGRPRGLRKRDSTSPRRVARPSPRASTRASSRISARASTRASTRGRSTSAPASPAPRSPSTVTRRPCRRAAAPRAGGPARSPTVRPRGQKFTADTVDMMTFVSTAKVDPPVQLNWKARTPNPCKSLYQEPTPLLGLGGQPFSGDAMTFTALSEYQSPYSMSQTLYQQRDERLLASRLELHRRHQQQKHLQHIQQELERQQRQRQQHQQHILERHHALHHMQFRRHPHHIHQPQAWSRDDAAESAKCMYGAPVGDSVLADCRTSGAVAQEYSDEEKPVGTAQGSTYHNSQPSEPAENGSAERQPANEDAAEPPVSSPLESLGRESSTSGRSSSKSTYRTPGEKTSMESGPGAPAGPPRESRYKRILENQLRRSQREVAVYFVVLMAALVGLLAVVDLLARRSQNAEVEAHSITPMTAVAAAGGRSPSSTKAAATGAAALNWSVAPCRDFHGFACTASQHGTDTDATIHIESALLKFLPSTAGAQVEPLRRVFRECLRGDDAVPFKQLLTTASLEGWPFRASAQAPPALVWDAAAQLVRLAGLPALIALAIRAHPTRRHKFIVSLEPPDLLINSSDAARNWTVLWHSRAASAALAPLGTPDAVRAARDVTNFERKLAVISADSGGSPRRARVERLRTLFRYTRFVSHVLQRLVRVTDDTEVLVHDPGLPQKLLYLLDETPPHVVLNYLGFRLMVHVSPFLGRAAPEDIVKVLGRHLAHHRPVAHDREHVCLRLAGAALPGLQLAALYRAMQEDLDDTLRTDLGATVTQYLEIRLQRPGLVDSATRAALLKRLRRLRIRPFFPDWVRDRRAVAVHARSLVSGSAEPVGLASFVQLSTQMLSLGLRQSVSPDAKWLGSPLDAQCARDQHTVFLPALLAVGPRARLAARASACIVDVLLEDVAVTPFRDCFATDESGLQRRLLSDAAALPVAFQLYQRLRTSPRARSALGGEATESQTAEQLFFVHFAQDLCATKARVNVPLSSSADFHRSYRCNTGDAMMPLKQCAVWSS